MGCPALACASVFELAYATLAGSPQHSDRVAALPCPHQHPPITRYHAHSQRRRCASTNAKQPINVLVLGMYVPPAARTTCSAYTARRTTMRRHSRRSRRCAVPRRSAAAASVCRGSPCQQRQPAWRCASSMPAGAVLWGMNRGRAQSRRRCGRGEPSPGADVEGVSPSRCQAGQWQVVDNQLDLLRSERGRRGAAGVNRSGTPSRTDRPISRCRTRTRARCVRARTHTQHSFLRLVGRRSPTQRKSTAR